VAKLKELTFVPLPRVEISKSVISFSSVQVSSQLITRSLPMLVPQRLFALTHLAKMTDNAGPVSSKKKP
jgi:hypothetical protein